MRVATDFFRSKTTWAGLIGVVSIILTTVLHRPDLVAPITGIIVAIEGICIRDAVVKAGEAVLAAAPRGMVG